MTLLPGEVARSMALASGGPIDVAQYGERFTSLGVGLDATTGLPVHNISTGGAAHAHVTNAIVIASGDVTATIQGQPTVNVGSISYPAGYFKKTQIVSGSAFTTTSPATGVPFIAAPGSNMRIRLLRLELSPFGLATGETGRIKLFVTGADPDEYPDLPQVEVGSPGGSLDSGRSDFDDAPTDKGLSLIYYGGVGGAPGVRAKAWWVTM